MERTTRQRTAIRDAIAQATRPLLAQEILEYAQHSIPGLGLATVYRNLKTLVAEGELSVVQLPAENPRYELVGHHHHHFQCLQCQRVFDVHACSDEALRWMQRGVPTGFSVQDHDLTLYGQCSDCNRPARPQRRSIK